MSVLDGGTDRAALDAIAFRKEKTAAKRLAALSGVTEGDALRQVLSTAALPKSLSELIADRQHLLGRQVARDHDRRQQQAEVRQRKQAVSGSQAGRWQAWFDGSATPNPGRIGLGAHLNSPQGDVIEISRSAGHGDSNDAEYLALIALLQEAVTREIASLTIYGDSRVVIEDVTAVQVAAGLALFRRQARCLLKSIGDATFQWIPRAKNWRADALARRGI